MERFKIDFFEKEYGFSFPEFIHLSEDDSSSVRSQLFNRFGKMDYSTLVEDITSSQSFIEEVDANENFNLIFVLKQLNINYLESVYINWFRFDNIDKIGIMNLDKYFYDIWYPGADDIDVFDSSFNWIISIRHDGCVGYKINYGNLSQEG